MQAGMGNLSDLNCSCTFLLYNVGNENGNRESGQYGSLCDWITLWCVSDCFNNDSGIFPCCCFYMLQGDVLQSEQKNKNRIYSIFVSGQLLYTGPENVNGGKDG